MEVAQVERTLLRLPTVGTGSESGKTEGAGEAAPVFELQCRYHSSARVVHGRERSFRLHPTRHNPGD